MKSIKLEPRLPKCLGRGAEKGVMCEACRRALNNKRAVCRLQPTGDSGHQRKTESRLNGHELPGCGSTAARDHSGANDRELVRAAKLGDMAAFEELVARHRDRIYACAFSILRNEEAALDLSQDAWVKGWQRLQQFAGDSSFRTWLTRVTINLCLDHLRKQKRHRAESIEALNEEAGGVERMMPVVTVNPTAGLERAELRQRIDQALERLSYEQRTVLVLREFQQMDYREIARAMKCSIGTVMSRLFYARRKLAALLTGLNSELFER